MSVRQDRPIVRTAADLERKYNLTGMQNAVERNSTELVKANNELESFVNVTLSTFTGTGTVDTWYYVGTPTLSNFPCSEWDDYSEHIDDLYYDKATGRGYKFGNKGTFLWEEITDRATISALALANSSSDTADSRRRVFTEQPVPPYDNGDIWFKQMGEASGEIYICQISKTYGEPFAERDFIIATKYTDDTVANQVGDTLEVVRGTVTEVQRGVDQFKIDIQETISTIDSAGQQNTESIRNMTYTFGTRDFWICDSTDPVNARIDNNGMRIYNYNDLLAVFNHNGSGVNKLIVIGSSQLANIEIVKNVDEYGDDVTDINFLVSEFQTLSDLL